MDKARLRPVATAALFVGSLTLSTLLLDVCFRAYEERFWIHSADPNAERYALAQYGYNDHEDFVTKHKRADEFRILSFGDSYAQSATKPAYSYASVLQRTLSGRLSKETRVVNFGVGRTSFPEYISQYRIWSKKLDFDGVLFNIFAGNDFKESNSFVFLSEESDPYRPMGSGETLQFGPGLAIPRAYPLRFIDYGVARFLSLRYGRPESDLYRDSAHAPEAAYLKTQLRQSRAYRPDAIAEFHGSYYWLFKLLVLAEQVRESKFTAITIAPPHAMVSPAWRKRIVEETDEGTSEQAGSDTQDPFDPALPGIVVRELADRAGYRGAIIDLTACLRSADRDGEEVYYGTNTHWSVRGNALVGQWLAARLQQVWLDDSDPLDRPQQTGCDTSPARASGAIKEALDSSFAGFADWLEFERGATASLLELQFDSIDEVFRELERLGYRRSGAVGGSFLIRPGYMTSTSHLAGWVTNEVTPQDPAFVVFFREGKLQSVGRTLSPETTPEPPDSAQGAPPLGFRSRIRGRVGRIEPEAGLWAIAISDGGLFARLTYRARLGRSGSAPSPR